MKVPAIGLAVALAWSTGVSAQTRQPPPPDTDYVPPSTTEPGRLPATEFVLPDVPDDWNKRTASDGRLFSTRLSVVALVDYTAFTQDANSVGQVGEQKNQWDVRTFRIMSSGQIKTPHPIRYLISVEVKGQDHVESGDSALGLTDWSFETSVGKLGTLTFGKVKEPFVYEMVGDAANLQQQERILSPFFVSRGIGLRLGNTVAHDRMTWSVGWFNDWWIEDVEFKPSGNDYAGRLTGLPGWSDGGANYVELGVSARHSDADQGTAPLPWKARIEYRELLRGHRQSPGESRARAGARGVGRARSVPAEQRVRARVGRFA